MALFGGSRDISLFNTLSKELINDIIQTEVGYYKFVIERTTANVYGESMGKVYYEPVRMACLLNREDQAWSDDDFGPDVNQSMNLAFFKESLQDINLFPEVGDYVLWINNFYEISDRVENQFVVGKDPDYSISTPTRDFGSSLSIICNAHVSRVEKLNLIPFRSGKYPRTNIAQGTTKNPIDC